MMTLVQTNPSIDRASIALRSSSQYCNLSRAAISYPLGANVFVQAKIPLEYSGLFLASGCSTVDAILAALALRQPFLAAGMVSVRLVRRRDGRNVEARLKVFCQDDFGHESLFLQLGSVHEL